MSEHIPEKIVFYDGDCGFCNRSVSFVLKHDVTRSIYFSALQSDFTKEIFADRNWPEPDLSTFYFLESGELYAKSSAAFRVVKYFPWHKKWLRIFRFLPRGFTDWVYDQVAKRRTRISKGYCVIPNEEQRQRFIN